MIRNLTVVIRTVGEITTELCYKQLAEVVNESNIFSVENVSPFFEAVKRAYQIGIEEGKKWTLIIDADVLINPLQLERVIKEAERFVFVHKRVFCINCLLFDKALMIPRIVGAHLYRTKYLKEAIAYVDDGKMELRPETFVKVTMGKTGFRTYVNNIVLGVHDFYQRPIDLLRKGFLHRKKHISYDETFEKWKELSEHDQDYFWLSEGAKIGEKIEEFPGVDSEVINLFFEGYENDVDSGLPDNMDLDSLLENRDGANNKITWDKYFGPDDCFEKIRNIVKKR